MRKRKRRMTTDMPMAGGNDLHLMQELHACGLAEEISCAQGTS